MDNPFNESDEGFFESGPLRSTQSSNTTPTSNTNESPESPREERSSVVAARGTAEGLVLRIDGRVSTPDLHAAVREFLESRRSFLSGHDVAFEWVGRKPEDSTIQELTTLVSSEFSISVRSSRLKTAVPKHASSGIQPTPASHTHQPVPGLPIAGLSVVGGSPRAQPVRHEPAVADKTVSLFDGMEGFDSRSSGSGSMLWDDPDARVIYGTLRSGQKVETEHSIVVFGDVNSGAEVIAGGDIVILGTLRGIAHAGAYDESGGGRVIFSLNLQPTQLRIGLVISRGAGGERTESSPRGGGPEIARVEGNTIVVEPYQSRTVWVRRRE
jgi:septum formation inhibitor MinC